MHLHVMGIVALAGTLLCAPGHSEESEEAIRRAVEKNVSVDFNETPLSQAIVKLAAEHGITGEDVTDVVRSASEAGTPAADAFLDAFAERLARGVAAVSVVLDPGLVVLGGDVAQAGGHKLAERVRAATARIAPNGTEVGLGGVGGSPVVRGALLHALERARDEVFSSTV